MPRYWHDRHAANKLEDVAQRDLCRAIVADKKPYFMRYIYPALMKQYNTYIKNTNRNALREFQMTVDELRAIPFEKRTERQSEFLYYYDYKMPVGVGNCVMNKICRRFEEEFDSGSKRALSASFDYTILKSDAPYSATQYNAIKRLYDDYNKRLISYSIFSDYERVDDCTSMAALEHMNEEFRKSCALACPNEEALCNIVLDMCYSKSATKKFAWSMCGNRIIDNLLSKHDRLISYPGQDMNGDIVYGGVKYKIKTVRVEDDK